MHTETAEPFDPDKAINELRAKHQQEIESLKQKQSLEFSAQALGSSPRESAQKTKENHDQQSLDLATKQDEENRKLFNQITNHHDTEWNNLGERQDEEWNNRSAASQVRYLYTGIGDSVRLLDKFNQEDRDFTEKQTKTIREFFRHSKRFPPDVTEALNGQQLTDLHDFLFNDNGILYKDPQDIIQAKAEEIAKHPEHYKEIFESPAVQRYLKELHEETPTALHDAVEKELGSFTRKAKNFPRNVMQTLKSDAFLLGIVVTVAAVIFSKTKAAKEMGNWFKKEFGSHSKGAATIKNCTSASTSMSSSFSAAVTSS